jgi:hypothetical protein
MAPWRFRVGSAFNLHMAIHQVNHQKVPMSTYKVQGFTSIEVQRQYHKEGDTILIGHRDAGVFIFDVALSMDMAESLHKQLNQLLSSR